MIFDCFPFFNELDLLEIRLKELSDVVDWFVLVEATKTHSGKDKPLYFLDNLSRFKGMDDRILNIIVEDMPMTKDELEATLSAQDWHWLESGYQREDTWVRERYQRNCMMKLLNQIAAPDDIIIIGDADEIVKASTIETMKLCDGSNAVEQTLNTYYVNWKCTNMPWWGSKIIQMRHLNSTNTPSEVRFHTKACQYLYNGGWHFGFLGGADAVKIKLQSYAHQEFNNDETLRLVNGRLQAKKDALGRLYEYTTIPISYETLPAYLVDNQEKFSHLIYKE